MFSYENFKHRMQRYSEEKVLNVVYATWYGNTWIIILVLILFADVLRVLMAGVSPKTYVIVYLILVFLVGLYIGTRKAGLALSKSKIVYVRFKHLGYREKEVFEIPFEKIKSLTVKKILNLRLVKLSFISNLGKFEKVRFMFSSFMIGVDGDKYKENSKEIYEQLVRMQKIIDRGDF